MDWVIYLIFNQVIKKNEIKISVYELKPLKLVKIEFEMRHTGQFEFEMGDMLKFEFRLCRKGEISI